MVTQTSLLAYERIAPDLGPRQFEVFQVLRRLGVASNLELAEALGWRINAVTPRVHELRHKFFPPLVVSAGKRACKVSNSTVETWMINTYEVVA